MDNTSWDQKIHALTHILTTPTASPPLHSQLFIASQIPCYLHWDYPPLLCRRSPAGPLPLVKWAFLRFLKKASKFGLSETSWRSKCPYQLPPPLVPARGLEEARWGEEDRIRYVRRRLRRERLGIKVNPLIGIVVPNLLLLATLLWDPMASDESEITGFQYEEKFILNSRGTKLFTCSWLPVSSQPKGLIFLCHGYSMECSVTMRGHGKSDGLQCYFPSFDDLVNDFCYHFSSVCEKKPDYWDMALLVAPMCKISDEMKPHPLVIKFGLRISSLIPKWKILPIPDIIDKAFRVPEIRDEERDDLNPLQNSFNLKVSLDLERRLEEVSLPFIVLHGGQDKATDPSVSQLLYQTAVSLDKTFKLYPTMWHSHSTRSICLRTLSIG
ncbi:alpha/beta-Hydrolases superfamily protein, partial [Striga asiatica]